MAYADDMARLNRRRMLAQALMQQDMQPQGQQAGRFYVGPTALSTIGQLGSAIGGTMLDRKLEKQERTATDRQRQSMMDALRGITGTPTDGSPNSMPGTSGPPSSMVPPDPQREAALAALRGLPIE